MKTVLFFFAFLVASITMQSATFTVINTNDSGAGSLREAITSANANPMDADNITFNIPTSDPNYNASTGVYTITLASQLPYITSLSVSIDGTTQPGNTNPNGPEICLTNTSNFQVGLCFPLSGGVVKGLIINGFQMGILISVYGTYPSGSCQVSDCYIGVNYDGTAASPNDIGIACYSSASGSTFQNNLISGNTLTGIGIRNSNSNTITGNLIGTDRTGMYRIPNYYGVTIDSASSNTIGGSQVSDRNIISGNDYAGVAINTNLSNNNYIRGNYIGTNINAITSSDTISNFYGIAINESPGNIIGGNTASYRNIISGNTDAGIAIMGSSASANTIVGNYIGTNTDGTDSISNGNGILLSGANSTFIGGNTTGTKNVISGNHLAGIAMAYSGTRNNIVLGNFIGTDKTGINPLSNHTGIYIFSNANSNIIGGSNAADRNIISANYEIGICMEASDSNIVQGNYIGPDSTGLGTFKFSNDTLIQGNGLYFNSNAAHNIAGGTNPGEGNVISGNRVYGLIYYGNSPYNSCIGNYIGVDKTGNAKLPNTTGICVDGGASHNPITNNVLSGNLAYGIFIVTTGTYYNELKGNMIGTNATGTDSVPNQIGVIMGGGTKYNTIGGTTAADRNIISGNYFDGIEVADNGTMYNNIIGNYIGTNANGDAAIPNYNGIGIATLPSKNNIENNVVSGNQYLGIILYEHSDSNTVYGNKVGTAADGFSALGNGGAGIVIDVNSRYNKIGEPGNGNTIAYNDTAGIVVADTNSKYNTFSANIVYGNSLMGIDLYPFGVNANDVGDVDYGCNDQMNFPNINIVTFDGNTILIDGSIDNNNPSGITIDLFSSDCANSFNHGDAIEYLGSTTVDSSGNWEFSGTCSTYPNGITATATDLQGNTSEFALNNNNIIFISTDEQSSNNQSISVFPNPANEMTTILGLSTNDKIIITDCTGRIIYDQKCNSTETEINLKDFPSCVYIVNILSGNQIVVKQKLIKL